MNLCAGSEDNFCRLDAVVRSTEYCDNYIVKIIENAGHWPHQEMPTEFNRVILKFLVGSYLSKLLWMDLAVGGLSPNSNNNDFSFQFHFISFASYRSSCQR